jgi:hypothetical protein
VVGVASRAIVEPAADALLEPKHIAHLAIKGKVLLPAGRARIEGRYGTNVPDSLGVAVPIPRYSALAAIANPRFGMIASSSIARSIQP